MPNRRGRALSTGCEPIVPQYADRFAGSHLWLDLCSGQVWEQNNFTTEDERMVVTLVAQLTVAYENLLFLDEIRRGEESLRRSERKYKNFVTNASYGICHADPEGRPLSANPALLRMLEYESEETLLSSSTLPFEKLLLELIHKGFHM